MVLKENPETEDESRHNTAGCWFSSDAAKILARLFKLEVLVFQN
ncbi:MAG: hypothetical protein OXC26_08245 [Albidovulum sp.]|nr:hypothetical protein [Albidovulum sp.]